MTISGVKLDTPGYIYFLCTPRRTSGIKIGFSKDPIKRKPAIKSEVGVPLELIGMLPGTKRHERALHEIFRHRRLHGEWFSTKGTSDTVIGDLLRKKNFPKDFLSKKNIRWLISVSGGNPECPCHKGKYL